MARFPSLSAAGDAVPASIFARLREHLAKFPGDVIPLQEFYWMAEKLVAAVKAGKVEKDVYWAGLEH